MATVIGSNEHLHCAVCCVVCVVCCALCAMRLVRLCLPSLLVAPHVTCVQLLWRAATHLSATVRVCHVPSCSLACSQGCLS
jgi:hypothetical protein